MLRALRVKRVLQQRVEFCFTPNAPHDKLFVSVLRYRKRGVLETLRKNYWQRCLRTRVARRLRRPRREQT